MSGLKSVLLFTVVAGGLAGAYGCGHDHDESQQEYHDRVMRDRDRDDHVVREERTVVVPREEHRETEVRVEH